MKKANNLDEMFTGRIDANKWAICGTPIFLCGDIGKEMEINSSNGNKRILLKLAVG